jgi:hypothetical protein
VFGWNKDEGRLLFFIKLLCTVIFRNRFVLNNCFAQYPMAFFEAKSHWESFGVAVMLAVLHYAIRLSMHGLIDSLRVLSSVINCWYS